MLRYPVHFIFLIPKGINGKLGNTTVNEKFHFSQDWRDIFVRNNPAGIEQAGLNIFAFKKWIAR